MPAGSEKHTNVFLVLEREMKTYWSNMKQNNSTELLGHPFLKIWSKNAPQIPTPCFSGIPHRAPIELLFQYRRILIIGRAAAVLSDDKQACWEPEIVVNSSLTLGTMTIKSVRFTGKHFLIY